MMTLTSGLTTNSYRRVSSGQASSCHSEPKGWGPLRLYLFTLCVALCTTAHSDSHYSQLLPITLQDNYVQPSLVRLACDPAAGLAGSLTFVVQEAVACHVIRWRLAAEYSSDAHLKGRAPTLLLAALTMPSIAPQMSSLPPFAKAPR
jgi:hypothetical protein